MCGIAGVLVFNNSSFSIEESYLKSIRDVETMVLRGPDGAGTWISDNKKVGLAHRRLSIIDLSEKANQPMSNEDGSILLSFNGEIYNHKQLRKELEALNKYNWKTNHSDTEVIIHAYEEWGISCLSRLRGMFAFALWDNTKEELFLVRDRLGIKPLYYSVHHGRIVFSSDINALLADKDFDKKVNEKGLYDYLSFLVVPAPDTLFCGINKLQNSTYVNVKRNGKIITKRYWDIFGKNLDLNNYSEKQIIKQLVEKIKESVRIHKESDVPVGIFLSGGIDSSLNAVLFSEGGKSEVNAFTISFDGDISPSSNEDIMAAKLVNTIKAKHYVKKISQKDILSIIEMLIKLQGEPLSDPVGGAQFYVSKLARDNNIIVCQIGEGMDELFAGYPLWLRYLKLEKYIKIKLPKLIKFILLRFYGLYKGKGNTQYEILRRYYEGLPIFWGTNYVFSEYDKGNLFSKRLQNKFSSYSSWEVIEPHYKRFQKLANEKSMLNWMTYLDLNLRMPDLLLSKVDKMGMGVSLEARVPFLDHEVVRFVANIPTKIKLGERSETKYFLKKAIKGLVPEEIIHRKKMGFILPLDTWYNGKLKDVIKEEVRFFIDKTDYFNKNEVEKTLSSNNTMKIWSLYTIALWWKSYFL